MSTPTHTAGSRTTLVVLAVLTAVSVVAGVWSLSGRAATWFPALVVPEAAGLPGPVPALRVMPLGRTTWLFWAVDLVAVLVMLALAWLQLRAGARRHPSPSRSRVVGRGVLAALFGLIAANIVRSVVLSFLTHAGIGMFAGLLVATIVVSAAVGVVVGAVAGLAAAVALPRRRT